ncbi:MAG: VWA domain-containing protein [Planctomycetes bacterium]|nr:VWA domain-containing protein [Planctomycetota bacterium]
MPPSTRFCRWLIGVVAWLVVTSATASAQGLIVIDRPPPGWRPPPHVPHPFAPLELRRHHVTVTVRAHVATTEIEQTFFNPNDRPLEGSYLLPVPRGVTLDSFAMDLDGTLTEAELLDADKARGIYEDIVRRTRDPALLEYAGQDCYKVRVFPIEPRKEKRLRLITTQLLASDGGMVEYRHHLGVEKFCPRPIDSLSVKVRIETEAPLTTIHSPSHEVEVTRNGERRAVVGFEAKDLRPDGDFRLVWGVKPDELVGLGLLCHRERDEEEGTFALFAAPSPATVAAKPQPKDIVFVLDTSGSMADGDKLGQARRALEFCLRNLDDRDRFGVVRFATEAESLAEALLPADAAAREKAIAFVKGFKPIGGTAIADALTRGLALATTAHDPARPCFVVFLTDGLPTVGSTDVDRLVGLVADAVGTRTIRVFCFGVGTDVNTHLLDRIVERTRAAGQYVLPGEDLELTLAGFYGKIANPVLANLAVSIDGEVRLSKIHPSPPPDLFQGEQLVVLGRFTGQGRATLTLTGTVGGEPRRLTLTRTFPADDGERDFLPRLWAVRRVGFLLDQIRLHGESREVRDEAATLARRFGIVTPYTSWLILEDEGRRKVATADRTLQAFEADPEARRHAGRMYEQARASVSGATAVGDAQAYDVLERADKLAAAAVANAHAWRGQAGVSVPGSVAVQRAVDAQQSRTVAGRTFYANAGQWIDARVQERPDARRERVAFASDAYFALLAEEPATAPWLALGRNVVLLVGDRVVEVVE